MTKNVCADCQLLSKYATQMVLGEDPSIPFSGVMFVGEAPGKDEDLEGRPFVGKAGQEVYDPMLSAVGLDRREVATYNIICCRPPQNNIKHPVSTRAIEVCPPLYLIPAIKKLKPVVIVALGRVPATYLLGKDAPIGQLRGKPFNRTFGSHKCIIIPTYHPAALLKGRNPENLSLLYKDVKRAISIARGGIIACDRDVNYQTIDTIEKVHVFFRGVRSVKNLKITYDVESQLEGDDVDVFSDKILGIGLSWRDGNAVYIPLRIIALFAYSLTDFWGDQQKIVLQYLRDILEDPSIPKGGQNKKYDNEMLLIDYGIRVQGLVFDTMLGSHIMDENQMSHALDEQRRLFLPTMSAWKSAAVHTDMAAMALQDISSYCCADADAERRLWKIHSRRIHKYPEIEDLYYNYTLPLQATFQDMEMVGAPVDVPGAVQAQKELVDERRRLESEMRKQFGRTVNVDSANELLFALQEEGANLDLLAERDYKGNIICGANGDPIYKTGREYLESLATTSPLASLALDLRVIGKLESTYVNPIIVRSHEGRVHGSWLVHGTVTGRPCVDKDTLVETNVGTYKISELDLTIHPNCSILTHTGNYRRILNKYYKGRELMYEVKTKSGCKIVCTAKHRFYTKRGWVALEDLNVGDGAYTYDDTCKNSRNNVVSGDANDFRRIKFCETVFGGESFRKADSRSNCQDIGISNFEDSEDASNQRLVWCNRAYKESLITEIKPVGIRDVWDIEVDTDHSYVAGGFVNHNSSKQPNLNNIPRGGNSYTLRDIWGKRVKNLYKARQGFKLLQGDFSQMEVRVLAFYAQDAGLIKACTTGDMHLYTGSSLYAIPFEEALARKRAKETYILVLRQTSKSITFLIIYGGSAEGAAAKYHIELSVVEEFMEKFFTKFSGVDSLIKDLHYRADTDHDIVSIFGRHRRLPNAGTGSRSARNRYHRQAVNSLIQGTASDICGRSLIRLNKVLREKCGAHVVLTVYDSIVVECRNEEVRNVQEIMQQDMVGRPHPDFNVQLAVDFEVGDRWGDLEDYKKVV